VDWFRQGLRYLGYVEGRNYVFVSRWAMGKGKRMPKLAAELVEAKVDVILVNGHRVLSAVGKTTRTIPIVVGSAANLAKHTNFVASLARPGGNVTGSTFDGSALNGKRLGLLKEAMPGARRVAFLIFRSIRSKKALRDLKRTEAAGKALGLKILPLRVQTLGETEDAFVSMVNELADALIINTSSLANSHRKQLTALAITKKLPTMCEQASFAHAGCLMAYSIDRTHTMLRAAVFVDKILKGAKPANLPVEMATRYKLVVNLKTAKALGITLPPSILLQATDVIE
jgi:putative ABC transport system substrate-binding protein